MKNIFLVMIAALSLAACGKKDKTAKSNSCEGPSCHANQVAYPINAPQPHVGMPGYQPQPGNDGSIIGAWCSVETRIEFNPNGSMAITRTNGAFRFDRYVFSSGLLVMSRITVPATITPPTAQSPALLYLKHSPNYTEVLEPCPIDDFDKDDEDDEDDYKPYPKPQPPQYPTPSYPTPPKPPKAT